MITKQYFGSLDGGQDVYCYTMKNQTGMSVTICEFGGAITEICVPDKLGRHSNVVAGYDSLRDYVLGDGYLGALVGRTANRIANGRFTMDGVEYRLDINDGPNSLHGGKVGYSHRVWNVKAVLRSLRSKHGGYSLVQDSLAHSHNPIPYCDHPVLHDGYHP